MARLRRGAKLQTGTRKRNANPEVRTYSRTRQAKQLRGTLYTGQRPTGYVICPHCGGEWRNTEHPHPCP